MSRGEGRRWLEVAVRSASAEDRAALLVEGLLALGGRAVAEEDGWLTTYMESPREPSSFRAEALARLEEMTGLGDVELRTAWREHEEWAESWKRGLGFRRITDGLAVRPSWVPQPPDAPPAVIVLDPGMAFGTAEHGTTRGCLRLLDDAVKPGQRILDVGAGSGVLAIAAALFGAEEVVALEADHLACEALAENLEHNAVADRVRWTRARVDAAALAAYGPVDGVVANIESGTLRSLTPGFARAVRPGGWLILSGILAGEWEPLRVHVETAGFTLLTVDEDGEWRAGHFIREA